MRRDAHRYGHVGYLLMLPEPVGPEARFGSFCWTCTVVPGTIDTSASERD
jgi:hypothetical protein